VLLLSCDLLSCFHSKSLHIIPIHQFLLIVAAAAAAAVVAFAVALNCLKGVFLGFGCCFVCLFVFFSFFWVFGREIGGRLEVAS
jgi:hypothetical protein